MCQSYRSQNSLTTDGARLLWRPRLKQLRNSFRLNRRRYPPTRDQPWHKATARRDAPARLVPLPRARKIEDRRGETGSAERRADRRFAIDCAFGVGFSIAPATAGRLWSGRSFIRVYSCRVALSLFGEVRDGAGAIGPSGLALTLPAGE